jgi:hypothetical protein
VRIEENDTDRSALVKGVEETAETTESSPSISGRVGGGALSGGVDIKTINGSIYKLYPDGKEEIIIDLAYYEDQGVSRFNDVVVSYDGSMICFTGYGENASWVYYSGANGDEVSQIALGSDCSWSHDNSSFAFNYSSPDMSYVDVYVYDISSKSQFNLTSKLHSDEYVRVYEKPNWSEDDTVITAKYVETQVDDVSSQVEGLTEIYLDTGELVDKPL